MADKAITVADIRSYGQPISMQVGESGIAPGMYLYADSADGGKLKRALRNGTLAQAAALYCAMTYASDDDYVMVQDPNAPFEPGFTVVVGEIYVLGTVAGGIEAVSDLAGGAIGSGHFLTIIGIGSSYAEVSGTATYNKLDQVYKSSTAAHA